jgi:isoleucyl-tRNA synthetase
VVVLATALSPELVAEGLAREVVHAIQARRKDLDLAYTDRIEVGVETADAELRAAIERFATYIQGETLAARLGFGAIDGAEPEECQVGSAALRLHVRRVG